MAENPCQSERNDTAITTTALECAIKFLQRYPQFTQSVINKSSYKFDIHSLIVEAEKIRLSETMVNIRNEFAANGICSEVPDDNQSSLEYNQSEEDFTNVENGSAQKPPNNNPAENNTLKDITNRTKKGTKRNSPKNKSSDQKHCVFCYNNGATKDEYTSHQCKDEWGKVTCPVLQTFVCTRCNATGENAHTAKYCPQKPIITPEDCVVIEKRWRQKRLRKAIKTNGTNGLCKPKPDTKVSSRLRV